MCNGCAFAEVENWVQTGCKADRLNLFKSKERIDGESEKVADYYVIDGLCNMYRKDDETAISDQLSDQQDKIKPKLTYFVISDCDWQDIEGLRCTLKSINDGSDVVIADLAGFILNDLIHEYDLNIEASSKVKTFCVMDGEKDISDEIFLSEIMGKIKNSLICVVWAGYNVAGNIEQDLDHSINIDMRPCLIYDYNTHYVLNSEVGRKIGYFLGSDLKSKLKAINDRKN